VLISRGTTASVDLNTGTWLVYVCFADKPNAVYKGDNVEMRTDDIFCLTFNVTNGNYNLEQIQ
jgi:hypothetical protein